MNRELTITTTTAQLSLLRYQNGCLEELLKKTKKTKENEYLSALNHSVSQLTNLFTKEIETRRMPNFRNESQPITQNEKVKTNLLN